MSGQPAVERALGVDVQRALDAEDVPGVGDRRVQAQRREVGDRVVDPAQPRDRQRLEPPGGAHAWRVASRRAGRAPARAGARRSIEMAAGQATRCLAAARDRRARAAARQGATDQAARGERVEHAGKRGGGAPPRARAPSSRRRRAAAAPRPRRRPSVRRAAIDSGVARASQSRPQWLHSSVRQPRAARQAQRGGVEDAVRRAVQLRRAARCASRSSSCARAMSSRTCQGVRRSRLRWRWQCRPMPWPASAISRGEARGCAGPARRPGRRSPARPRARAISSTAGVPCGCGPSSKVSAQPRPLAVRSSIPSGRRSAGHAPARRGQHVAQPAPRRRGRPGCGAPGDAMIVGGHGRSRAGNRGGDRGVDPLQPRDRAAGDGRQGGARTRSTCALALVLRAGPAGPLAAGHGAVDPRLSAAGGGAAAGAAGRRAAGARRRACWC